MCWGFTSTYISKDYINDNIEIEKNVDPLNVTRLPFSLKHVAVQMEHLQR